MQNAKVKMQTTVFEGGILNFELQDFE